MKSSDDEALRSRRTPIELSADEFRKAGHRLVDDLAGFLESLPSRRVTSSPSVAELKELLGDGGIPEMGMDAGELLTGVTEQLIEHSLFNGHPRFWGYVTSPSAPIGALGDFLASVLNQNVGAWQLSPLASEIEIQTIRWMAEFVGYPASAGGLIVSGGNMANFVGFLAGRRAGTSWDVRKEGLQKGRDGLGVYCSEATHTWVQKAADLFGLGTDAIRWIPCDFDRRMDVGALKERIDLDVREGKTPLLVVASAGTVETGAWDPMREIADLCAERGLWLHVDGAYGGMAASLPEADPDLKALSRADSVALDPHKWLYTPLEAGCVLVRDPSALRDTFSFRPGYYKFEIEGEQPPTNFYELGPQNSRGFRALKVWLAFRQVGRSAFIGMIREDCRLAQAMANALSLEPGIEVLTRNLSIVTFRFRPPDTGENGEENRDYLNELNEAILVRLQREGDVFLSNAILDGIFALRACIVNFRTRLEDVEMLPGLVSRTGREIHDSR